MGPASCRASCVNALSPGGVYAWRRAVTAAREVASCEKNKSVQKGFAAVKRRLFPLAATVLLAACLSGCSWFGMDAENLMQPPKPTGEREAILPAAGGGGSFRLYAEIPGQWRLPLRDHHEPERRRGRRGHRVFFSRAAKNVSGISVIFMKKTDGVWSNVGDL